MPLTRLPLTTGVSGTLPIGNGGTNVTTSADLANTGNLVLLSSQTASSDASVIFDNTLITSTYDDYLLIGACCKPATDNVTGKLEISTDNGSNFLDVYVGRHFDRMDAVQDGQQHQNNAYLDIIPNAGNDANLGHTFRVFFHDIHNTGMRKHGYYEVAGVNTDSPYIWKGGYQIQSTSTPNYMKYSFSSGNIAEGTFTLYGVRT